MTHSLLFMKCIEQIAFWRIVWRWNTSDKNSSVKISKATFTWIQSRYQGLSTEQHRGDPLSPKFTIAFHTALQINPSKPALINCKTNAARLHYDANFFSNCRVPLKSNKKNRINWRFFQPHAILDDLAINLNRFNVISSEKRR